MDALTSLNTRRAESFHPFSKKIEKKKKTNCKTVRFRVIVEDGTPRIAYQKMSLTLPLRRD